MKTTDNPMWEDGVNAEMVIKHYGYDSSDLAPARGFWKNDGSVLQRLAALPETLQKFGNPTKRVRVIFDYDPDYPRALLQVQGLSELGLND